MNEAVESWLKRTEKKAPFYLFESVDGHYTVIFKHKKKVRVGGLSDGMHCRYGIGTFGALSGVSPLGLWQSCAGAVSQKQLDEMILVAKGQSQLPVFDVRSLKNLKH